MTSAGVFSVPVTHASRSSLYDCVQVRIGSSVISTVSSLGRVMIPEHLYVSAFSFSILPCSHNL